MPGSMLNCFSFYILTHKFISRRTCDDCLSLSAWLKVFDLARIAEKPSQILDIMAGAGSRGPMLCHHLTCMYANMYHFWAPSFVCVPHMDVFVAVAAVAVGREPCRAQPLKPATPYLSSHNIFSTPNQENLNFIYVAMPKST